MTSLGFLVFVLEVCSEVALCDQNGPISDDCELYTIAMTRRSRCSKGSSRRSAKVSPILLPLQPLKCGQRIDPTERMFLEAAERGDKPTMIRCLKVPNTVNVNCTNMLGRSAIQIAVDNENVEIVELLLKQNGVKIGDALLYAIREGVYRIVEMLIDHQSISSDMLGTEWTKSKTVEDTSNLEEGNDYPPDISPLILAAHCNQFEILQLLLTRGAVIDRPHQLSCSCTRCQEKVTEDGLRHSLRRINTYRALASPAWISLTSSDPILSAFKLSWELERLALRENEFKDTYLELSDQCKRCACDLLDQCRSTEEVIAVLNKDNDSDSEDDDDLRVRNPGKMTLSRLKLALKYQQKEFVAHPNCQQLLTTIWYEGLPGWRKRNAVVKFVICVGLVLIVPFMAMYYLIFPHSQVGRLLRSPFMKFLYHSASFVAFLILLVCASSQASGLKNREKLRGPAPSELEWLICIWVTGFIWAECKQLWEEGLKAYARQWWNWLDFIMLSLYLTTFTLRFIAYFQIESGGYGPAELERRHWPLYDPTMVSEGLFAVANVFSFARLIFLFQDDQYLGPLQISLGCMLIDIGKFLFIFFLVLTSFACGLNQLYSYYNPNDSDGNPSTFYTLESSYSTLYWSLFSLTQVKDIKIAGGQYFTEMVGELLFMAYHCMAIIVLINMLIAMMSNSFQEIENHADMEWKFSRSKLWMGYFDEGSTLPPPFNLVISPKAIYYVFTAVKDIFCKCCGQKQVNRTFKRQTTFDRNIKKKTLQRQDPVVFTTESSSAALNHTPDAYIPTQNGDANGIVRAKQLSQLKYQDIMRRLVSRFIHQTKKKRRQDGVNEDDLLEIKQDISSLRYEIREDRKRENYRTGSRLDSLRGELLGAIWNNNSKEPSRTGHQLYNNGFTHLRGLGTMSTGNGANQLQSELQVPSNIPNDEDSYSAKRENSIDRMDNTVQYQKPFNYTTAKVANYLSQLGDSFSSQTTDNYPMFPNISEPVPYGGSEMEPQASKQPYACHLSKRDADQSNVRPAQVSRSNSRLLTPEDIDSIKLDILSSLKSEIQDSAREVASDLLLQTMAGGAAPALSSELYQTHLYTQL